MSSPRDPWIDNAKFVFVTLVVIGHSLMLVPFSDAVARTYDFIYLFHIPAFVLVSGYLSRRTRWDRKGFDSILTTLVVPYVIFEFAMATFRIRVGGESGIDQLWINPHWPMWYLIVLTLWRLATPLLVKHWSAVPLSIVASLLGGLYDFDILDLDRALGLLPFFVVGLHLRPGLLALLRRRGAYVFGAVVFVYLWWLAGANTSWQNAEWLYYRSGYATLGVDWTEGMWSRLRLLAVGFLGAAAALAVVPRRHLWITAMGAYSLVVYLIHGFVIRSGQYLGYETWLTDDPEDKLVMTAVLAVLLSLLLAWLPVATRLYWLCDPINAWRARRRRRADLDTLEP